MNLINRQIHLLSRPAGAPHAGHFGLVSVPVPALEEGQVLVRHHYLSLEPHMRRRMNDTLGYAEPHPSTAAPHPLNAPMIADTLGEVLQSRNPRFVSGDWVVGAGGWQEYSVVEATRRGELHRVKPSIVPLSTFLGTVGYPGLKAWYGLEKIIDPKPGQTVTVSAAASAVGIIAGQLARHRGARVVGIASGMEECTYLRNELGLDACIDEKALANPGSLTAALAQACPKGIDGHLENLGGPLLDKVMQHCNPLSRIALSGSVGYTGQDLSLGNPSMILTKRMRVEGYIITEHQHLWAEAFEQLLSKVAKGLLRCRETVVQGLENAPGAFISMVEGRTFGKHLVRLVDA